MNLELVQKLLKDPYCLRILDVSFDKARTMNFYCMKFDIPVAICHRIVGNLSRMNLLLPDKKIMTGQGKWVQLYRSNIRTDPDDPSRFKVRVGYETGNEVTSVSALDTTLLQEVLT